MNDSADVASAKRLLATSPRRDEQDEARRVLQGRGDYLKSVLDAYLLNPFLILNDAETEEMGRRVAPMGLRHLILARDAATRSKTPKYVVFCMPKSGSSFIQSALSRAFDLPVASLTSVSSPRGSSMFGMNPREQELDELALCKSVLNLPKGFVAQHHTRYSIYLGLQVKLYGITPIITIRNVLDAIVSYDDMIMGDATLPDFWVDNTQFPVPADYAERPAVDRYRILCSSIGVWLINFYLLWKRARRDGVVAPLVVNYEAHVLNPDVLVDHLAGNLGMSGDERARLDAYVRAPDRDRSRINVGRRGRGAERLPDQMKGSLLAYAEMFRGELSEDDITYLVR